MSYRNVQYKKSNLNVSNIAKQNIFLKRPNFLYETKRPSSNSLKLVIKMSIWNVQIILYEYSF